MWMKKARPGGRAIRASGHVAVGEGEVLPGDPEASVQEKVNEGLAVEGLRERELAGRADGDPDELQLLGGGVRVHQGHSVVAAGLIELPDLEEVGNDDKATLVVVGARGRPVEVLEFELPSELRGVTLGAVLKASTGVGEELPARGVDGNRQSAGHETAAAVAGLEVPKGFGPKKS